MVVLRPGAIGDTIVTLPALLALRRRFPGARIEMAGNPTALPLLASSELVDRVMPFDDARVTRLFVPSDPKPDDPFLGIDVAIAWCTDPDGRLERALRLRGASAVVMAPSRPPVHCRVHVARHLLCRFGRLGIDPDGPLDLPPLRTSTASERQAGDELRACGLEGRPFVAMHPGSGSPAKNWPAGRFGEVISMLETRHGLPSLVVGGPADLESLAVLRVLPDASPSFLLDQPLPVVAAVLRRARAFLGNDSGLAHLAGVLGVPTLALFGPTDPVHWSPLGPRVRTLRSATMADISFQEVVTELELLLAGGRR